MTLILIIVLMIKKEEISAVDARVNSELGGKEWGPIPLTADCISESLTRLPNLSAVIR